MINPEEYLIIKNKINKVSPEYAETLDYLIKRELGRVVKRKRNTFIILLSIFHAIFFHQSKNRLSSLSTSDVVFVDLINRLDHKKKFNKWMDFFKGVPSVQDQEGVSLLDMLDRAGAFMKFTLSLPVIIRVASLLRVNIQEFILLIRYFIRFEIEKIR